MLQKVTIKTIKKITKANKQRNCFKTKISKQAITFEKKNVSLFKCQNNCFQYTYPYLYTHIPFTQNTLKILFVFRIYFMITYLHAYYCWQIRGYFGIHTFRLQHIIHCQLKFHFIPWEPEVKFEHAFTTGLFISRYSFGCSKGRERAEEFWHECCFPAPHPLAPWNFEGNTRTVKQY